MRTQHKNKAATRVVIQGGFGAFHELAAIKYFEDEEIEVIPKNTFKEMMRTLGKKEAEYGIMAIENNIAGSILPNYNLLTESNERIIGEIYLRIEQNLVALPGQTLADIKEVYSHPMAILQCQTFFDNHPEIRLIDSNDTALSAQEIQDKQLKGVGAIASSYAAEQFELEILAKDIETNPNNYTRFLILQYSDKHVETIEVANKSSIHFALAHKIGSLSKILSILSFYDINLSKIQSMPIVGRDWEYKFYVDVEFDDYDRYHQSLEAIKPFTSELGVLGEYQKGKSIL